MAEEPNGWQSRLTTRWENSRMFMVEFVHVGFSDSECFEFFDAWAVAMPTSRPGVALGVVDPLCARYQHGRAASFPAEGLVRLWSQAFTGDRSWTCIEQAQLYILCQVQRLLITLLLTLYHIGQCLADRGICLFGIYLTLWHKSNMIL